MIREKFELTHWTVEICFARDRAESFRVFYAEVARNFGIDIAQHRVVAKSAHTQAIDSFCVCIEPRIHHGLRSMPVGKAHALSKAVVERVVQI